jgi:hypothetical protein
MKLASRHCRRSLSGWSWFGSFASAALVVSVASLNDGSGMAWGQQDPFGAANPFDLSGPAGGPAMPSVMAGGGADEATAENPLVSSITQQDLSTPERRLLAVETLFLLQQPAAANRLMDALQQPLTGEAAYDLVWALTSPRLLGIEAQEELAPQAAAWLRVTMANAMQYAQSEPSTARALERLQAGSNAEQTLAREQLLTMGVSAAPQLLTRMQSLIDASDLQSGQLRQLIQIIQAGPDGWDITLRSAMGQEAPLETAAMLGLAARGRSPLNQAAVLEWTLRRREAASSAELAPVLAFWRTQLQQQFGIDANNPAQVAKWFELLNQQQVNRWTSGSLSRYQATQPLPTHWLWDAAAGGFTPQQTTSLDTVARDHALLATAWLRADETNEAALRNFVAAQFKRAKLLGGLDQPLPPAAVAIALEYLSPVQLTDMLQSALDRGQWLLAQSLLEALETAGSAELLTTTAGRLSAVVQALKASDARVRLAAVQTILTWRPESSFAGASYFNQELRELFNAPFGADVLIASMNPYHSAYLEALTRQAGWQATVASSAGQLVSDFDLFPATFLIITDALGDVPYLSVIDKIRTSAKGKTIPILLLVRTENLNNARKMLETERPDPMIRIAEMSEDGSQLLPWLEEVSLLTVHSGQLSSRVALDHAEQALTKLQPWLESQSSRRLLDFSVMAAGARGLLGLAPTSAPNIVKLLSHYGDPETQVYLASVAADAAIAPAVRSTAAAGFRDSVQRFGTLLTSDQIRAAYDRQNRSAQEGEFTQALLNSLLDTLEARSRRQPFDTLSPVPTL